MTISYLYGVSKNKMIFKKVVSKGWCKVRSSVFGCKQLVAYLAVSD